MFKSSIYYNKIHAEIIFILIFIILSTVGSSFATTINDIEIIPKVTIESTNEGYSPFVAVNPVDKFPHVFWCKNGDIYHSYRKADGAWKAYEIFPDGGYNVYSVDEDEDSVLFRKPIRNVAVEFDTLGVMHLVFAEENGGIYHMKRSGGTWTQPQLVCKNTITKVNLDIALFENRIYICYEEGRDDKLYTVEFDGTQWKKPLFMTGGEFCYLATSDNGYLYFSSRTSVNPRNAYFAYIAPGGTSWQRVNNVTNATIKVGAGPHLTVSNGRIFLAWPGLTNLGDNDKQTALFCASALEPGNSWTPQFGADTLFYENTGDPFPRVAAYEDGTVVYLNSRRLISRFMIWNGTAWSGYRQAPWGETLSEVASDGLTVWVISLSLSKSRPWWKGPISITGLKNIAPYLNVTPPELTAANKVNGNNLQLTFTEVLGATSYRVYRGTTAVFTPDLQNGTNRIAADVVDQDTGTPGIQWTDTDNVTGNPAVNYFYAVTAVGAKESDPSNKIGEFDYQLVTTTSTDFNEIALPLELTGITKANELMNVIPYCNSIARWDAASQGYVQYIPELTFTDFDIQAGRPYYVNITANSVFTLTGSVISPVFNLLTTESTSFNEIVLPLDKTSITKASELLTDVQDCDAVAQWNAVLQNYDMYIPAQSFSDFQTKVGYPYYIHVTSGSTWPGSGLLKNNLTAIQSTRSLSKVPHAVYGNLNSAMPDIHFTASIEGRPDDILTEKSPGCFLQDSKFVVQTGSFIHGWQIGDKLKIQFHDVNGNTVGQARAILSANAFDKTADTELTIRNIPADYHLMQNFPNPFNPETLISFSIPKDGHVGLLVFNTMGQKIRTLVNEYKNAGTFNVTWDGRNDAGLNVSSGTYIYVLKSGDMNIKRKAVLLR
ncbi:T9SS type A sorting domain-containing protein [candidate division KSB1 bacterium]|nr:T9SS type A sorting domain-containing protein [candidate division KSB1 bacterium]